jgi:Domain of unknown function (DUF3361)
MSVHKVAESESSSEWQSYSSEDLSAQARSETLIFKLENRVAHEPPAREPLLGQSADRFLCSSSQYSRLTSARSLETVQRFRLQRSSSHHLDARSRTPSSFIAADASRPVFLLPTPTYNIPSLSYPSNFAGMDTVNVPELVERLGSDEDAVRKMAVFKLQSNIGDPSFAEIFIQEGGLQKLKYLTMRATGNTLAYSLTSFSRLLEVDKGWDFVEQDLIERVGSRILGTCPIYG